MPYGRSRAGFGLSGILDGIALAKGEGTGAVPASELTSASLSASSEAQSEAPPACMPRTRRTLSSACYALRMTIASLEQRCNMDKAFTAGEDNL